MDLAQYFNTMNVLKLKQIIKEEVEKALKEAPSSEFAPIESALNDFYDSYLAKDLRLSKEITPEERIERLQSFAGLLKSYIGKLNSGIEEEEFWISKNQGLTESEKEPNKEKTKEEALKLAKKLKTKYASKGVEGLRDDKEFKQLKKDHPSIATEVITTVRTTGEMES